LDFPRSGSLLKTLADKLIGDLLQLVVSQGVQLLVGIEAHRREILVGCIFQILGGFRRFRRSCLLGLLCRRLANVSFGVVPGERGVARAR